MEPDSSLILPASSSLKDNQGCSGLFAMILISIWILLTSVISQIVNWSLVQTIFEGSLEIPDVRWLVLLVYSGLLLIPLLIAHKIVQNPLYQSRFKSLAVVSGLALFLSISRVTGITDWQLAAAIQIAVILVFLLGVWIFRRKNVVGDSSENERNLGLLLLALAAGGILGIPWVLWGAQGSQLDSLLALLVAVLLGTVAASILIRPVNQNNPDGLNYPIRQGRAGTGWTITLGLFILATAADQNGNGWILAAAILPLGFGLAMLAIDQEGVISSAGRIAAGVLATLGFAWPILMVDPDELSFVISSGTGELLEYVTRGAFMAFGLAVLITLLLLIFRKWIHTGKSMSYVGAGLFVLSWLGIFALYGFQGKPGYYGEKSFVILKSQADLSAVQTIKDPLMRRETVYRDLVNNAEFSQKDLRSWLDDKNIAYKPYYLVNAIELDADPILRAQLAARADVDRVLDSPILRPLAEKVPVSKGFNFQPEGVEWNLDLIGATAVHTDLKVMGEGIIVGQSDSGAQSDHPEFASRYRGAVDGTNNYNWFDPWYGSKSPVDIGGHGTHTLGTMLGENVGVAPKAEWIGCVNLARNLGNPALYLDCMQFMLAPFPQDGDPFKDGKPEKGANVLNNSWGCPVVEGCDAQTYLPAVKALKEAGVFVVASAGNSGYGGCSTVQDPLAIYDDVYTVGAIDSSRNLAGFSSLGPVEADGSGRTKPDIMAPGVDILSSFPGSTYEQNSGTSMAGPHIVGVVALMWSANPDLIGNVNLTREIINQTADPYEGVMPECVIKTGIPDNAAGYGIVNAYKAVQKALEIRKK